MSGCATWWCRSGPRPDDFEPGDFVGPPVHYLHPFVLVSHEDLESEWTRFSEGSAIRWTSSAVRRKPAGRAKVARTWKVYMRRQTQNINYGRDLPLAQGVAFDRETRSAGIFL
jgi:hypothetical protein